MKRLALALACAACGHAAPAAHPVVLALTPPHLPTLAERRAEVCARSELVVREGPLVATSAPVVEKGVVRSVAVRDTANREVVVDAQVLAPLARDAAFDMAQAREVVRRLWALDEWDDVAVETSREGKEDIAVVFRLSPRRAIANVFADEPIPSELGIATGKSYDPVALVRSRKAYEYRLSQDGHLDAKVILSSAFADIDHRSVDVCARVELGPRVVLDQIVITGTAYTAVLEPIFANNAPNEVLDDDVFERDVSNGLAALYDRGLIAANIRHTTERRGDALTVHVVVVDGGVYRYSSLDVRGDLAAPKAEYMSLFTQKKGDVFDRSALVRVVEKMRALDAARGQADLEITPDTALDEKTHTVALVLGFKKPTP